MYMTLSREKRGGGEGGLRDAPKSQLLSHPPLQKPKRTIFLALRCFTVMHQLEYSRKKEAW
jgi:hypothetical protein